MTTVDPFDEAIPDKDLAQHVVDLLSEREMECFLLFGKGVSTKEVAFRLGITVKTAATHRKRARAKLKLNSQESIAILAWRARRFLVSGEVIRKAPIRRSRQELPQVC
jgi:DNA-binding CsgD family transcriptional regulator